MTATAPWPEVRQYHDLEFSRDVTALVGYAKCKACGYWVNAEWWASEPCPGPTRKEEK